MQLFSFLHFRSFPKSENHSSIPLTGDKRADADIMAFIKARQNLLQRKGEKEFTFFSFLKQSPPYLNLEKKFIILNR